MLEVVIRYKAYTSLHGIPCMRRWLAQPAVGLQCGEADTPTIKAVHAEYNPDTPFVCSVDLMMEMGLSLYNREMSLELSQAESSWTNTPSR